VSNHFVSNFPRAICTDFIVALRTSISTACASFFTFAAIFPPYSLHGEDQRMFKLTDKQIVRRTDSFLFRTTDANIVAAGFTVPAGFHISFSAFSTNEGEIKVVDLAVEGGRGSRPLKRMAFVALKTGVGQARLLAAQGAKIDVAGPAVPAGLRKDLSALGAGQ
jgi:hypothetical protein